MLPFLREIKDTIWAAFGHDRGSSFRWQPADAAAIAFLREAHAPTATAIEVADRVPQPLLRIDAFLLG